MIFRFANIILTLIHFWNAQNAIFNCIETYKLKHTILNTETETEVHTHKNRE